MPTVVLLTLFLAAEPPAAWTKLPSLPDREGWAGMLAGVSHGTLIVAGGANFPDKKPWDGGMKQWSDKVFALTLPSGEWKAAGTLPKPRGYGVCVTDGERIIVAGGSDAKRHYAEVESWEWVNGTLKISAMPPLPVPLANACGAVVKRTLYVAGGQKSPYSAPLKTAYALDLDTRPLAWKSLDPCPGPGRMLAMAASFDGAFWFLGGVDLTIDAARKSQRLYLKDVWRFDPGRGWKRAADLPVPLAAAASPCPTSATGIYVLGGDDGSQVTVEPLKHRGFRKTILSYDFSSPRWTDAGTLPAPRVTLPCVPWKDSWILPSGEVRPGIRSPDVWQVRFGREN